MNLLFASLQRKLAVAGCLYGGPINPLHILRVASADTISYHNKFGSFHDFATFILRAFPILC